MLPMRKIDDGSLKICKVEISRSRRDTESSRWDTDRTNRTRSSEGKYESAHTFTPAEKTSRVVGGTNIKECFQNIFMC